MPKILVVDDEVEIVKILEEFLSKMGFEVIKAVGGEEGNRVLRSDVQIDLLILDMKMPKVRGVEVLSELKKTNRKIPVIILTGSIDLQRYKEQLERLGYGLNDVCDKPIDLYVLLGKVKEKLK